MTAPDDVRSRRLALAAAGLALAAAALLAVLPVVATRSAVIGAGSDGGAGQVLGRSSHESLVARGGLGVLAFLALPALIASVPALLWLGRVGRVVAWCAAALLSVLVLATGFSIGLFYAPAAALAVAAAAVRQGSR